MTGRKSAQIAELLDRLEKATGPDRSIDLDIARLRGVTVMRQRDDDSGADEYTHWRYTESIDAALTLVPSGARLRELGQWGDNGRPGGWFACVLRWQREIGGWCEVPYDYGVPDHDTDRVPPLAPNGAIAVCIAALKADGAQS
jgi:hypothetical protein